MKRWATRHKGRDICGVLLILSLTGINNTQAAPQVCMKDLCVTVEVVSKMQDMQKGLQGRDGLAQNHGMLFVFDREGVYNFWMKDMKFPIDMIWLDEQYRIVSIIPSREPCRQDPCEVFTPTTKSRYVLEVSSGFALEHHLKLGDVLQFHL